MKKLVLAFLSSLVLLFTACSKNEEPMELDGSRVLLFYQTTCPHCHDAEKYIKENHPDLKIVMRDVRLPGNQKLFNQAVKKYKIKGAVGTPLICFDDEYIMGWSEESAKEFEMYVKPYEK